MKIFISWSGDLSNKLGETLKNWLPQVIQSVEPYFTSNDIEKGARWSSDICSKLEQSNFGLLCLTKDNLTEPWLLFEAGALSKKLDHSRVCPILFDIQATELVGPLAQFQATSFDKDELKKLIVDINSHLGERKLSSSILDKTFEKWWPQLDDQIKEVLKQKNDVNNTRNTRTDRELLEEVLGLSRLIVSGKVMTEKNLDKDSFVAIATLMEEAAKAARTNKGAIMAIDLLCYACEELSNLSRRINTDSFIVNFLTQKTLSIGSIKNSCSINKEG